MSYERWIGWRYLYGERRDRAMAIATAISAAVGIAGVVMVVSADGASPAGVVTLVLGMLGTAVFGLLALFSVFTSVSVLGVVLGVAALTVVLAVTTGFQQQFRAKVLGVHAHVTITKPGASFLDYREVMDRVIAIDPDIVAVQPFVYRELMMTNGKGQLSGIAIKGVDPVAMRSVLDLDRHVIAGSLDPLARAPGPGELPPIVLGKQLAHKLETTVGGEVIVVVPLSNIDLATMRARTAAPRVRTFQVVAIFYSGFDDFDRHLSYASLDAAQRLLDDETDGDINGLELKVRDLDRADAIADKIAAELGEPPYQVQDWYEMNQNLFVVLTMQKLALTIILTLIITVATFNMVSALTMMVTDKTREVAILKSMGARSSSVGRIFLLVGVAITGVGTLVGVGVGLATCAVVSTYGLHLDPRVYMIDRLPIEVRPLEVALVCGITLVIGVIATVVPARRAAALPPVEGLRYD